MEQDEHDEAVSSFEEDEEEEEYDGPIGDPSVEKIKGLIEMAENKATPTRLKGLNGLIAELSHNVFEDKLDDHQTTLLYICEKAIKRGKSDEISLGARLTLLIAVQNPEYADSVSEKLSQVLLTSIKDTALSYTTRADCCTALCMVNFLGNDDYVALKEVLLDLENIFAESYYKKEKQSKSITADKTVLHVAALNGYALLLTSFPANTVAAHFQEEGPGATEHSSKPTMKDLIGLLNSPHLNVRLATGELIALVIEKGRCHEETFLSENVRRELVDTMRLLVLDSSKSRARDDRKAQRSTFREIVSFVENNEPLNESVKILGQKLSIKTWVVYHQYNAMCDAFGTGITAHLRSNALVRDILQLGEPQGELLAYEVTAEKRRQKFMNAIMDKARTVVRNKGRRDKQYGTSFDE